MPGTRTLLLMTGGSTGQHIDGRFELLERLGTGGMGTVWRARDLALEREVALKEVRPPAASATTDEDTASRKLRERVLREARALARINHPAVVTIHHIIDQAPHPWLVMELVPGSNLHARLAQGPLEPPAAARLGREVLGGLRAAHAAGILHRDVKPANVLLRTDGSAVLTDFGIAALQGSTSLTATGELIGSPEYIAPEHIRSAAEAPAADLWSLGMLLYVAVEGHSPLRRETALATLAAVFDAPIPPPVRSGPLTPVLNALLVREPTARPDATTLDAMLAQVAQGTTPPPHAPPALPATPPPPPAAPAPPASPPSGQPTQTSPAPARPAPPQDPPVDLSPPAPPIDPTPQPIFLPPPPRERNRKALAVGAGVGALLLLGGIVSVAWLASSGGGKTQAGETSESATTPPKDDKPRTDDPSSDAPDPTPETSPSESESPTASASPDGENPDPSASRTADEESSDPTPTPPGSAPGWVAQLASEAVSGGTAARDRRLATIRKSVPEARVLRSDSHASLNPGYWVIYAPGPFADGRQAISFCASKGRTSPSNCVGRYVSDRAADRVYVCHPQGGGSGRCTRS